MSNVLKIGFLGGGKMAQSLAKGFIQSGLLRSADLIASAHPTDEASLKAFREDLSAEAVTENRFVVEKSQIVFISVKPNVVKSVLDDVKKYASGKLFVSIAMGTNISAIEKILPNDSRVARIMTNTPAFVQAACSVFVRGKNVNLDDVNLIQQLMSSVGTCEEVSEQLLDTITALSGSIFMLIESLADGGVKCGLSRELAYRLAAQTVFGSAKLVIESKIHPAILRENVTSPSGSTSTGLLQLEKNNFRSAIIEAVEAATNRCREISGNLK